MRLIKKLAFNVGLVAIFVGRMWGQVPAPTTISLGEQPLPVVTQIGTSFSGTAGNNTYCYWVVAEYAIGNAAISAPSCRGGVGTGTVTVTWQAPATVNTLNYSLGYDVIRTTSNVFNQSCTACLLTNSTTGLSTTDNLGTLALGYTINQYGLSNAVTSIDNTSTGNALMYTNQNGVRYPSDSRWGATLPTYCNVGDSFYLVGTGPYFCATANTFVSITPGTSGLTTIGAVPFVTSPGILGQDPADFFWNATNNRLQIGPTATTSALGVSSSTLYESTVTIQSSLASDIFGLRINSTAAGGKDWRLEQGRAATGALAFYQATSGAVPLTILSGGNVGIGTTTPAQSLEVSGGAIIASGYGNRAAATGPALEIGWTGTTTILQSLNRTTSIYVPAQYSALNHSFDTSGSARMTILGGGNVGIGTTTPAQTLHVKSASNEILSDATTGDATLSTAIAGVRKWSFYNQGPGNNLWFYDWTNSVARLVVQPGTATAMTILASGNVGIGTTTPISAIDVQSTALTTFTNNPIIASLASTTAYAAGMGPGIQFSGKWNASNAPTTFAYIGGVKENATDGNYAGKLVFGTRENGSAGTDMTRMTILSSGNVGIGTATPGYKLEVAGSSNTEIARVGDGTRSFGISTYTPNSGGVTFKNSGTGLISLTAANAVLIGTGYAGLGSGVPANTVAIEGNVGIGTTTPVYGLDVAKSGASGTARFYDQTATTGATGVTITRGAAQTGASTLLSVNGVVAFTGDNNGGAGTALLGSNSPAVTNTAPYTWIKIRTADNSVAYIPVWK